MLLEMFLQTLSNIIITGHFTVSEMFLYPKCVPSDAKPD